MLLLHQYFSLFLSDGLLQDTVLMPKIVVIVGGGACLHLGLMNPPAQHTWWGKARVAWPVVHDWALWSPSQMNTPGGLPPLDTSWRTQPLVVWPGDNSAWPCTIGQAILAVPHQGAVGKDSEARVEGWGDICLLNRIWLGGNNAVCSGSEKEMQKSKKHSFLYTLKHLLFVFPLLHPFTSVKPLFCLFSPSTPFYFC